MRAVIQRVKQASVTVDGRIVSSIKQGLLVLLGIEELDRIEDAEWLCTKIRRMRIFNDEAGLMNKDITEVAGDIIVVSQFTLLAATKKGNRPSFIQAARPEHARPLYETFVKLLESVMGKPVGTGVFGADMDVALINDGPVTILIDTKNKE